MYKASVILPCYNGARWVSGAIESVLAQTYRDFELLIINDGSTDNSKKIVASYLSDERVRYIYQRNRGFSAAINRGIQESNGSLIGFIGQDDLWLPNKLELQLKYFSEHNNLDLLRSNYYVIDSEGRIICLKKSKVPIFSSRQRMVEYLFLNNFIGFETVLVKRNCFDEVGLFDERMVGFSDHDMWLRIAGSFNIGYLDLPLIKKREHELRLSKVRFDGVFKDGFLLTKKAIGRYSFLKKVERKKIASLYYAWGITLLQKGHIKEAEQKLLKAIRYQPWKLKATIAYIAPTLHTFILNHYQEFAQLHRGLSWVEG
jgi:glycosyltransferase involved in cell wall biosynthesis